MSLFIGRLPSDFDERELEELFEKHGKILECKVKRGSKFAFGFVDFEDSDDAKSAMKEIDGMKIDGVRIAVEQARGERKESDSDCFKCGERGHWARYCTSTRRKTDRGDSSDRRRRNDSRDRYSSRRRSRSPRRDSSRYDSRSPRRDSRSPRRDSRSSRRDSVSPRRDTPRRESRSPRRRDSHSNSPMDDTPISDHKASPSSYKESATHSPSQERSRSQTPEDGNYSS